MNYKPQRARDPHAYMKATESSRKRSEAKQEDKLWTVKQLQKDPSGRNLVGFFDLGKVKSYY